MIRHYFKLKEFVNNDEMVTTSKPTVMFLKVGITHPEHIWPEVDSSTDVKVSTIWTKYIYPRYWNSIISYCDNWKDTYTEEELVESSKNTMSYILSWFRETYNKYSIIIDAYESVKNNLMDDVKSTVTSVFNDTPQDVQYPDVLDGQYATNTNTTTSSAQIGTKLQRLNEIENNLNDIYEQWSSEFEMVFIIK